MKKLLSFILVAAMLFSTVAVIPALATSTAADFYMDVVLTEGEHHDKPGIFVEFKVKGGAFVVGGASYCFSYDPTILEMIDKDGEAIEVGAVSVNHGASMITHMTTNFVASMCSVKLVESGSMVACSFTHATNDGGVTATDKVTLDKTFLAYKDGKSIANVTKDALRPSNNTEKTALKRPSVYSIMDDEGEMYTESDADFAANVTFGAGFDFAKDPIVGSVTLSTDAPVIDGAITATPAITSTTPGDLTYTWYRVAAGNSESVISGATGASYTPSTADDVGCKIKVAVSAANYSGSVSATTGSAVVKKTGPSAPTIALVSKTDTTVTVTAAPATAVWQYSKNNGADWQESNVFTGLTPNTAYSIIARVKETATQEASGNSAALSVTTDKAASAVTGAPTAKTLTYNGNAQALVNAGTGITGGDLKYAKTASTVAEAPADASFDASIPEETAAGTYKVWYKVFGDADHEDTDAASVTVTIAKKNITGSTPTYSAGTLTYNGTAQTPANTVTVDGLSVTGSWGTVTNVADSATFTANGNFEGTVSKSGLMDPASVSSAVFGAVSAQDYTGAAITPEPTVTVGSSALTKGIDFDFSYEDNTYVGTAAKVKITGKGNYSGNAETTFTIQAIDQTPTITATANLAKGGNTLDLSGLVTGAQGTVSFTVASGTAATLSGTTLTSTDNTGDVVINVSITDKDVNSDGKPEYNAYTGANAITVSVVNKINAALAGGVTQQGCTFGETLADPTFTAPAGTTSTVKTYEGILHKDGSAYSSANKPTEAGSYTVKVTCETATHIYEATSEPFTIAPKAITGAAVTLGTGLTYTSAEQTQTVTKVELGNVDITGDVTVSRNTGTAAGEYTLTVAAKDASNYTGSVTKSFTIAPVTLTVSNLAYNGGAVTKTYDGSTTGALPAGAKVEVTSGLLGQDTLDLTVKSVVFDSANVNDVTKATVTVNAVTTGNYRLAECAVEVTDVSITKADVVAANTARQNVVKGVGTFTDATFTGLGQPITGTFTYTVTGATAAGNTKADIVNALKALDKGATAEIAWTWTPDSGNFNTATGTINVTVVDVVFTAGDDDHAVTAADLTVKPAATYGDAWGDIVKVGANVKATLDGAPVTGDYIVSMDGGVTDLSAVKPDAGENTPYSVYFVDGDAEVYFVVSGTVSIAKQPVTVTAKKVSISTGGKVPTEPVAGTHYTVSPAGVTLGGAAVFTFLDKEGTEVAVEDINTAKTGTYTLILSGLTLPNEKNYTIEFIPSTLNITSGGGGGRGSDRGEAATPTQPTLTETLRQDDGTTVVVTTTPDGEVTAQITVPSSASGKVSVPVKDAATGTVPVIVNKDGTETVVKMSAPTDKGMAFLLEGSAAVKFTSHDHHFVDTTGHWSEANVHFVHARDLFRGVDETHFDPEGTMTRSMMATVLFRLDGEKKGDVAASFADVESGLWYSDAVGWAANRKIVEGYNSETFAPADFITREQLAVMVYRYAQSAGLIMSPRTAEGLTFADADQVSDWAVEAMTWALDKGIITGRPGNIADPGTTATRAEVATVLERFVEFIVK